MNAGSLVVAYHGCDVTTRDRLVRGELRELTPSNNRYDWLGNGSYFFEGDALRAARFAHASSQRPERLYTKQPDGCACSEQLVVHLFGSPMPALARLERAQDLDPRSRRLEAE